MRPSKEDMLEMLEIFQIELFDLGFTPNEAECFMRGLVEDIFANNEIDRMCKEIDGMIRILNRKESE